jgi:hypothetical protein
MVLDSTHGHRTRSEIIAVRKNVRGQKFQIENSLSNDGLVEPEFHAMSQKFYCATLENGLVEPFPQLKSLVLIQVVILAPICLPFEAESLNVPSCLRIG